MIVFEELCMKLWWLYDDNEWRKSAIYKFVILDRSQEYEHILKRSYSVKQQWNDDNIIDQHKIELLREEREFLTMNI